jgi:hypothetical protein
VVIKKVAAAMKSPWLQADGYKWKLKLRETRAAMGNLYVKRNTCPCQRCTEIV